MFSYQVKYRYRQAYTPWYGKFWPRRIWASIEEDGKRGGQHGGGKETSESADEPPAAGGGGVHSDVWALWTADLLQCHRQCGAFLHQHIETGEYHSSNCFVGLLRQVSLFSFDIFL